MPRRRKQPPTKINPHARAHIARWLRECRTRGIHVERVHPAVLYLVRHADGITSHLWGWAATRPVSELVP